MTARRFTLLAIFFVIFFTGWITRPHWWLEKLTAHVEFGSNKVPDARVYVSANGDILLYSAGSVFVIKSDAVLEASSRDFMFLPGMAYSRYRNVQGLDLRDPKIDGSDPKLVEKEREVKFNAWRITW